MANTEVKPVETQPVESSVPTPKPWEQEWAQKPVQAVAESVQSVKDTVTEAVKGFKWPWERDWMSKTPEPTQTPEQPVKKAPYKADIKSYMDKLIEVESSGRATVKAKTSSAVGVAQFTATTWMEEVNKLDLPYTLKDRTDPAKVRTVLEKFTERNAQKATKELGREPTPAELYMYHFVRNNAGKLINAPEDAPAINYVSKLQATKNKSVFFDKQGNPKTAGEVMNRFRKKFGEA